MLEYCLGKYKIQEMYEKTVDTYPLSLKYIPSWCVTYEVVVIVDNSYKQQKNILKGDIQRVNVYNMVSR